MKEFVLVVITIFFFSCQKNNKEQVFIAGSTTVLPIVVHLADDFVAEDDAVQPPIVSPGGSGVGFSSLCQGKINIAMMSRDITQQEREIHSDKDFVVIPIAYDTMVPTVSSEVYDSGITTLSLSELAKIYSGKINNWKELGGVNRSIVVYDKEASRGTRHVYMKILFGDGNAKALGADGVVGSNNEGQRAIMQSDSAIGILSFAWINDNVKALSIKDGNNSIVASKENIINGRYPLQRALNLVTLGPPKGAVKRFIDFILNAKSQEKITKLGYVSIKK